MLPLPAVFALTLDSTRPELMAFSIYHTGRLILYFSEPVVVRTFNLTGIELQVT